MNKKYVLMIFALVMTHLSIAQCYTDEYHQDLVEENPSLRAELKKFIEDGRRAKTGQVVKNKVDSVRIIPVVFHVIHTYEDNNISRAQIMDQLRILNEDYRRLNADTVNTKDIFKSIATDMKIEFRLATIDPNGNCTDGITRTYSELTDGGDDQVKGIEGLQWNYRKYLNIYVVERIARNWNPPSFVAGYAAFPMSGNSAKDGIIIRHDFVGSIGTSNGNTGGRVLTHEIGHWLGLLHPFQGGCNGQTFIDAFDAWIIGDDVDDTPPVRQPNYGCPSNVNSCGGTPDQVENFMDYADGSCQNMFSAGQSARVDEMLSLSSRRQQNVDYASSVGAGDTPTCHPVADFHTENLETIACEGVSSLFFKDHSYNGEVTKRTWIFEDGTPSTSSEANPQVIWNIAGHKTVTLIVENEYGKDTLIRSRFINVLPQVSPVKAPFSEDFENLKSLDAWELESDGSGGWVRSQLAAANGVAGIECEISANSQLNTRYSLTLTPIDIAIHGTPINLTFKHAYSRATSNATEVLFILASDDCGASWKTVTALSATNGLASVSGNNLNWRPTSASDWGYRSISLDAFASVQNLMLRFDVLCRNGNSVYLDDINIAQFGLGIPSQSALNRFVLRPNPAADMVHIDVDENWLNSNLEVRDLSGRLLLQSEIKTVEHSLNTADWANGVYVVHLVKAGIKSSQKLIINR